MQRKKREVVTRRLFSPAQFTGIQQAPCRGRPRYHYKCNTFISGLLLLTLKLNQVAPLPTPSPHQIALHVTSMVDPVFMAVVMISLFFLYIARLLTRSLVGLTSHHPARMSYA